MKITSLIFLLVCAIPLFGGLFYILRKDNPKKLWPTILLAVLLIVAVLVIATLTKDLAPAQ